MLDAAKGSAVKLVQLVVKELPSFGDKAVYDGRTGACPSESLCSAPHKIETQ